MVEITFRAADFPVEDDTWNFVSIVGHQPQWQFNDQAGVWFCVRVWPSGEPCTTERPVGADMLGVTCQRRHIQRLGPTTP
jgi:hypothetical protein